MPVTRIASCPTCSATVDDDDRVCGQCGAVVREWPALERTPLILPGNPAFSEELPPTGVSPFKIAVASAVGSALLLGVLYFRAGDEGARAETLEPPKAEVVASAPAPTVEPAPQSASTTLPPMDPIPSATGAPVNVAAAPAPSSAAVTSPAPVATEPALVVQSAAARNAATLRPEAPAPTPAAAVAPAAPTPLPVPTLRMEPLDSRTIALGSTVRLRGRVQDATTGRPLDGSIAYISSDPAIATVDSRTGTITARAVGRVNIIADAGRAGRAATEVVVRAPSTPGAPAVAVEMPTSAQPTQVSSGATRPVAITSVAPMVTAPPTNSPAAVRDARLAALPDAGDVRTAADRIVSDLRSGGPRTPELTAFFADGANHRVTMLSAPTPLSETSNSVRVRFEIRLTKFDAGGRPMTRVAPITMDVAKRDAAISTSAVAIGSLQKP